MNQEPTSNLPIWFNKPMIQDTDYLDKYRAAYSVKTCSHTGQNYCVDTPKLNNISGQSQFHRQEIPGTHGTLGENLIKLANSIVVKDAKSKYFSQLSKNGIIDMSINTASSHVKLLGGARIQNQLKAKYGHRSQPVESESVVKDFEHIVKKIFGVLHVVYRVRKPMYKG
ncbi:uncharacterized protein EV154DRAFT_549880 [Mucor mucedo]|uniref:uncharacterized protein n=1 Tax=Mucor mucedo TaxID=29922 RepID=UPI00221FBA58|nr:uncharacterized protein EV154DRAFT_549880 [Mucor mucedo]KAI7893554.1 hypothetical protein EV154DRAFT_549880 [Mucor mucedo]